MDRKAELLKQLPDENLKKILTPLINDLVFLENTLSDLRKLPFIRISEKDPSKQKPTPASKQYKELLQQYNNSLKIYNSAINHIGEDEEDSIFRQWIKQRASDTS